MNWLKEREILEKYIKERKSYKEIGEIYGYSESYMRKLINNLGLTLNSRKKANITENDFKTSSRIYKCLNCDKEFSPFNSNVKFCSQNCCNEYKKNKAYELLIKGDSSVMTALFNPRKFKQRIIEEQGNVCAICGCPQEHNGKPLIFILDYIDGHAANNKRDNLRCVCPNCDSQLETYKNRNKHNDRHEIRYKKIVDLQKEIDLLKEQLNKEI